MKLHNHPEYFLTIAETKSISRAAEILHISQPSLSKYLKRLEEELGVKLLDRSITPMQLTTPGKICESYLKAALNLERRFSQDLDYERKRQEPPLTIGLPMQASPMLLNSVFRLFLQSCNFPESNLFLQENTTPIIQKKVLDNEIDMAFVHTLTHTDAELQITPLERQQLYLIRSPEHTAFKNGIPSLFRVLNDSIFYIFSQEHLTYQITQDFLSYYNIRGCQFFALSNMTAILDMIACDSKNSIALVPDVLLDYYQRTRNVEIPIVPVEYDLSWYFSLIRRKDKRLSPAGRAFWDFSIRYYSQANS